MVWEARLTRFFPQEEGLPGPQQWLIVARHVLTDEIKYFLSNAPEDVSREELLHVAFSRAHIERLFEDAKGQVGLDHFEVRKYRPLMRHLVLSMVSLLFLMRETARMEKKGLSCSAHHLRQVVALLLDPDLTPAVKLRKLHKLIDHIEYDQRQAEKARRSHLPAAGRS